MTEDQLPEEPQYESVAPEDARQINIAAQVFWMLVCAGFGLVFWGAVAEHFAGILGIGGGFLTGAALVLAMNAAHHAWSVFGPDEDLSEVPTDRPLLMSNVFERRMVLMKIIILLSVAPSMYLWRIRRELRGRNAKD